MLNLLRLRCLIHAYFTLAFYRVINLAFCEAHISPLLRCSSFPGVALAVFVFAYSRVWLLKIDSKLLKGLQLLDNARAMRVSYAAPNGAPSNLHWRIVQIIL